MRTSDAIYGYAGKHEYDDNYAKAESRNCEFRRRIISSLKDSRIKRKIAVTIVTAAMLGIFGSISYFQLGFSFLIPEAKYSAETIRSVEGIASLISDTEICEDAVSDVNRKYRWGDSTTDLRPFSDCISYVSYKLKCFSAEPADECSNLGELLIRIEEAGGG